MFFTWLPSSNITVYYQNCLFHSLFGPSAWKTTTTCKKFSKFWIDLKRAFIMVFYVLHKKWRLSLKNSDIKRQPLRNYLKFSQSYVKFRRSVKVNVYIWIILQLHTALLSIQLMKRGRSSIGNYLWDKKTVWRGSSLFTTCIYVDRLLLLVLQIDLIFNLQERQNTRVCTHSM